MPWLEPDVNDHLGELAAEGVPGVVLVPVGFVSDHMEVVYDLDTEALATAVELGLPAVRAATPGVDPRFVAMVRDLLVERAAAERGEEVERPSLGTVGPMWDLCPVGCCAAPRRAPGPLRGRRVSADLLAVAVSAARAARELVVAGSRRGEVTVAATKSSDVDVVTEADRAAEGLIRERLALRGPTTRSLGEEGDDVDGTTGVRWVVDPIDGTVNFLYGLPQYAVSIAAEVDGEVVAGVVLNIATGVEYTAHVLDGGAIESRRDGELIRVRDTVPLGQRLVSTGSPTTRICARSRPGASCA